MHIPDGFLSVGVATATWTAAAIGVASALRAEKADSHPMPAGILGATAAFLFAAQMINVPIAPGVSGHLVGSALAAALVGPWRALIAMAVVLAIQAVLFQDGGISALGANIFDMGVAGVAVAYAVAALAARWSRSPRGFAIGVVIGAFAATTAASVLTGIWLGLSGLYPLGAIVQIMLVTHVAVGVLEAALTGAIVVTVLRWRPDLVRGLNATHTVSHPAAALVGILGVAIVVAAFVSPFASALPDGLEQAAARLGFAGRAYAAWPAPLAGYSLPLAASGRAATAIAGTLGTIAVAVLAWVISRSLRSHTDAVHR
ncbi:MAG: energy-coupling factor ABC transporter permease [Acidobacteria bacterium]|nr:energy-coupling factor ABC transporter permease [Acidobacteriota bacterium]